MVLVYMVTWIPSIYPLYVSIYTSTMDPSWVDRLHGPQKVNLLKLEPHQERMGWSRASESETRRQTRFHRCGNGAAVAGEESENPQKLGKQHGNYEFFNFVMVFNYEFSENPKESMMVFNFSMQSTMESNSLNNMELGNNQKIHKHQLGNIMEFLISTCGACLCHTMWGPRLIAKLVNKSPNN